METIISHGFWFSVETENTHKEELTSAAAEKIKATLDGMGADRVANLHTNLVQTRDFVGEDYDQAARAGELVIAYEDFGVSIAAETA